jgi:hypothetical protein
VLAIKIKTLCQHEIRRTFRSGFEIRGGGIIGRNVYLAMFHKDHGTINGWPEAIKKWIYHEKNYNVISTEASL